MHLSKTGGQVAMEIACIFRAMSARGNFSVFCDAEFLHCRSNGKTEDSYSEMIVFRENQIKPEQNYEKTVKLTLSSNRLTHFAIFCLLFYLARFANFN